MRTASKTKRGVLALALAGLLMAFAGVVAVPSAASSSASSAGHFGVTLDWNGLVGDFWPAGVNLTVTADDPGTGASPDIELTLATDASGGFLGDQVFPGLRPGWLITVTDGGITKTHIVRDISITDVNPATEIMRGTADPGSDVLGSVRPVNLGIWAKTDSNGVWSTDFTGQYDLTPGSITSVLQMDEDNDFTFTDRTVPRPEGWQHNPVTGHDYLYFGGARPWVEAEAYAVSLGGHLVTINNAAEDAWLVATFGTEYFIGFNDRAVEGAWVWVSGEPVTFTNWLVDEPNDSAPGEDVAMIWNRPPIGWNDIPIESWSPFVVEVAADTTPPEITVPASITVDATGPGGAAVAYTVTATDDTDPGPVVTCTPPSGTTFPIGDTTVACTATDASGNTASASFTVQVKGQPEQLADLAAAVKGVGPGKSLSATVTVAQWLLAHGQTRATCLTLTAFNLEVRAQSGKKIPAAQATALIADANRIKTVLGCAT